MSSHPERENDQKENGSGGAPDLDSVNGHCGAHDRPLPKNRQSMPWIMSATSRVCAG